MPGIGSFKLDKIWLLTFGSWPQGAKVAKSCSPDNELILPGVKFSYEGIYAVAIKVLSFFSE